MYEAGMDRGLADLLSNGFNPTGIFSNLARGLVAIDPSHVEFAGDEHLGELVYRYTFRVSPETAAWQIQSHSQNGTEAGKAGEEGSFWLDKTGQGCRYSQEPASKNLLITAMLFQQNLFRKVRPSRARL
jgi:hypothetical protein